MIISLNDYLTQNLFQMPASEIEVGKLYAGHKDGIWYRVMVIGLVGTDSVSTKFSS